MWLLFSLVKRWELIYGDNTSKKWEILEIFYLGRSALMIITLGCHAIIRMFIQCLKILDLNYIFHRFYFIINFYINLSIIQLLGEKMFWLEKRDINDKYEGYNYANNILRNYISHTSSKFKKKSILEECGQQHTDIIDF